MKQMNGWWQWVWWLWVWAVALWVVEEMRLKINNNNKEIIF